MKPRVIKNNADHDEALRRIDALMDGDPSPKSDAGRELELLSMLVEQYEDIHYPIALPDPIEAIKFMR